MWEDHTHMHTQPPLTPPHPTPYTPILNHRDRRTDKRTDTVSNPRKRWWWPARSIFMPIFYQSKKFAFCTLLYTYYCPCCSQKKILPVDVVTNRLKATGRGTETPDVFRQGPPATDLVVLGEGQGDWERGKERGKEKKRKKETINCCWRKGNVEWNKWHSNETLQTFFAS